MKIQQAERKNVKKFQNKDARRGTIVWGLEKISPLKNISSFFYTLFFSFSFPLDFLPDPFSILVHIALKYRGSIFVLSHIAIEQVYCKSHMA